MAALDELNILRCLMSDDFLRCPPTQSILQFHESVIFIRKLIQGIRHYLKLFVKTESELLPVKCLERDKTRCKARTEVC